MALSSPNNWAALSPNAAPNGVWSHGWKQGSCESDEARFPLRQSGV